MTGLPTTSRAIDSGFSVAPTSGTAPVTTLPPDEVSIVTSTASA